jgi:arsenate reductase
MPLTMYGIPACDTIKKARTWLGEKGVAFTFHNYKTDGIDRATLERWVEKLGWEALLNRSGTTFRKVPEEQRADLDRDRAIAIMLANPSAIRRPVLEDGDTLLVGFKPESYAQHWS